MVVGVALLAPTIRVALGQVHGAPTPFGAFQWSVATLAFVLLPILAWFAPHSTRAERLARRRRAALLFSIDDVPSLTDALRSGRCPPGLVAGFAAHGHAPPAQQRCSVTSDGDWWEIEDPRNGRRYCVEPDGPRLNVYRCGTTSRAPRVFVSFKTVPDAGHARRVAHALDATSVPCTFLHGDRTCPYPVGSEDAALWIDDLLRTEVGAASVLVLIASEATVSSDWVLLELDTATRHCEAVVVIDVDGHDPRPYLVPQPSGLFRWLIPAPVFGTDAGRDPRDGFENQVRAIAAAMTRRPRIRLSVVAWAASFTMLAAVSISLPYSAAWMGLVAALHAATFPTSHTVRTLRRRLPQARRLTHGPGLFRMLGVAAGLTATAGSLALGPTRAWADSDEAAIAAGLATFPLAAALPAGTAAILVAARALERWGTAAAIRRRRAAADS